MMFCAACQPCLHCGGGDARHERAVVLDMGQVADDVDIVVGRGWSGRARP